MGSGTVLGTGKGKGTGMGRGKNRGGCTSMRGFGRRNS